MADPKKTAALLVGVSKYEDAALGGVDGAAASARRLGDGLDKGCFRDTRVLVDPGGTDELFLAIQKACQGARGGSVFFYYAGHVLLRGAEVVLTVGESKKEGAKACVPWSDIESVLDRAGVRRGLVVLNVDLPGAAGAVSFDVASQLVVFGSARPGGRDPSGAQFLAYGDALREALQKSAPDLKDHVVGDKLDASALARVVGELAAADLKHRVWSEGAGEPIAVRDFAEKPVRKPSRPSIPDTEAPRPEPAVVAAEPAPELAPPAASAAVVLETASEPEPVSIPEPVPEPEPAPKVPASKAPAAKAPAAKKEPAPIERAAEKALATPSGPGMGTYALIAAVVAVILWLLLRG